MARTDGDGFVALTLYRRTFKAWSCQGNWGEEFKKGGDNKKGKKLVQWRHYGGHQKELEEKGISSKRRQCKLTIKRKS